MQTSTKEHRLAAAAKSTRLHTESCKEDETFDYIFGFGSIINTSTHATWSSDKNSPALKGAVVTIKKSFGYKRKWNFRSATGFTALGVVAKDLLDDDDGSSDDINGVLFQVPSCEISNFDRREVGYKRVEIPLEHLEFQPDLSGSTPQTQFCIDEANDKIWLYIPLASSNMYADENHPLLQSYVDTVLQGCLEWGGESMAEQFIITTGGWSCFYLNDCNNARRPWLFRKEYATIDKLLSKHSELTNYGDRRHPEEFASAFNQRMKGTWSIPKRNPNFTGREDELDQLRSKFSSQEMGRQRIVVKAEVCGMGGVGKTQLVTEYCYRHFPSRYGLVVWLNAETTDTLITDYRQLLADLANNNIESDMDKNSTEEIIGEVKSRLFRSNVPWLLIFDNLEDRTIIERFVPNGAGTKGHILVTTRHAGVESGIDSVLSLKCLTNSEAIELLRRSAGEHNMEGATDIAAAEKLCEKFGELPLALSIAAAYMRKCDVTCKEYYDRYTNSEKHGQSLLGGKVQDYSMTVASSLSLVLPKIAEENEITSQVIHLVSYLGPESITKMLVRNLLTAKRNVDLNLAEEKHRSAMAKKQLSTQACIICGLFLSGAILLTPATNKQRQIGIMCALLTTAVTSICVIPQVDDIELDDIEPKRSTSTSQSFSAFEYEQSDISWDTLKQFSLLSVKEGKGSVHRLLQQAIRSIQSSEESIYYITICIEAVSLCWTFRPEASETWKPALLLLEHVKSVVGHSQDYNFDVEQTMKLATLSKEAGVLSAMALNEFVVAQSSLELSNKILERSTSAQTTNFRRARASVLHELSKIHRYQGRYDHAHQCLMDSLVLSNIDDCLKADNLHELGILGVKQHQLDSAAAFLQQSLDIRRGLDDDTDSDQINASSTLHQLAAISVARKPPQLIEAKGLLEEALSLSRQIGQRAATIRAIARITIRQGSLDQADSYLEQALQLYLELYDNNKLHINVAAVKFQQGVLAYQRERYEDAKRNLLECLRIRRHVYAYAAESDDINPINIEIASVLHELGQVEFAQGRFAQSMGMFNHEKAVLERLAETSTSNSIKIYQFRLNNLTWLKKCSKERHDEEKSTLFTNEINELKKKAGEKSTQEEKQHDSHLLCESVSLQQTSVQCRLLARRFALEKKSQNYNQSCRDDLLTSLDVLAGELAKSSSGEMSQAASSFRNSVMLWIDKPKRRAPILNACDSLRDVLRAYGIQINDSSHN